MNSILWDFRQIESLVNTSPKHKFLFVDVGEKVQEVSSPFMIILLIQKPSFFSQKLQNPAKPHFFWFLQTVQKNIYDPFSYTFHVSAAFMVVLVSNWPPFNRFLILINSQIPIPISISLPFHLKRNFYSSSWCLSSN